MEEVASPKYYSLTFKKNEEARLDNIFLAHCGEDGRIHLPEFVLLNLEKGIISNSCPLQTVLNVFNQSIGESGKLSKSRFFFSISLLARYIYPEELNPVELIFTKLLVDMLPDGQRSHVPKSDAMNSELLKEESIKMYEQCEEQFQKLMIAYLDQNIEAGRKVVGWKQIKHENLGILPRNFLSYCRLANLVPHIVNIETLQDCIASIMTPQNSDERLYFESCELIKEYESMTEVVELKPKKTLHGEPKLLLHHIQMILGRIALEGITDEKTSAGKLKALLFQNLGLKNGSERCPGMNVKYGDNDESDTSFSSIEDEVQIRKEYNIKKLVSQGTNNFEDLDINDGIIKLPPHPPSIEEIRKLIEDDRLPKVPPKPDMTPRTPLPPEQLPVQFALPKPQTPPDKRKTMMAPKPKNNKKKEETAGDRLKFAPLPGSFIEKLPNKTRADNIFQLKNTLESAIFPSTFRQTIANPAVQPCIIQEILLPPASPAHITTLIESALVYQNTGNLYMALKSLDQARKEWSDFEGREELKPEIEFFFELSKAAIYESSAKDELALSHYFYARPLLEKMQFSHPDRALLYCGLGSVLYHMGHYTESMRCYLMAKGIRERTIGGDTVDTATIYNNCGVGMYSLNRQHESFAYLQLAEAILDMLLGPHHPRTLTTKQNIMKVRRSYELLPPDYQPLWSKEYVDLYAAKKTKKKGKKKGKKKK